MTAQRLLILGASGRTGRPLVRQDLAAGFLVRAFVRAPARFDLAHPSLEVFAGDVLDAAALRRAVEGCDAVLSTLGRDGRDVRPLLDGTQNLIAAMRDAGVRRVVCMSSMGAGSTAALAGPVLNAMIALMGLRPSFAAKGRQEVWLRDSGLDVSLLFAGSLTDGAPTGRPEVTSIARAPRSRALPPRSVHRADVAAAMLEELVARAWLTEPACVVGPSR
jgi:nucleoside-diphosphate-sugar epimerase